MRWAGNWVDTTGSRAMLARWGQKKLKPMTSTTDQGRINGRLAAVNFPTGMFSWRGWTKSAVERQLITLICTSVVETVRYRWLERARKKKTEVMIVKKCLFWSFSIFVKIFSTFCLWFLCETYLSKWRSFSSVFQKYLNKWRSLVFFCCCFVSSLQFSLP